MTTNTKQSTSNTTRYLMVAVLAAAAFFGAYRFAQAGNSQGATGAIAALNGAVPIPVAGGAGAAGNGAGAGAGAGAGGGCCGSGGNSAPIAGSAKATGGVQKISVDLSTGSYNPNVIKLKAGVPAEITFGQGSGCTAVVQSADLGFSEDLSSGPKTVKLQDLKPGTYTFACGMNMVTGQIVVE